MLATVKSTRTLFRAQRVTLPLRTDRVTPIVFTTDVEGNGEKFYNSINTSSFMKEYNEKLYFTHPRTQFVYGGDAVDKGPYSIRIMQSILALKAEEPNRVHLIVGNREAKMTRLWEEMRCPRTVRSRLCSDMTVFWENKQPPSRYMSAHINEIGSTQSIQDYVASLSDETCQSLYLRWMLTYTMGCGLIQDKSVDTFELYRQELCDLTRLPLSRITDEDVTAFLLQQVQPGGVFYDYLSKGVLCHRIGDTLFVHGAIPEAGIGYIPGRPHTARALDMPLDQWIEGLNGWFKKEVKKWKRSESLPADVPPGDSPLMKYLVFNPKTVTTSNWYNPSTRKISPLSDVVANYLTKNGIRRVMTGHQPFSDCPLVLKHEGTGLEVVVGDTSYSDPTAEHNTQGIAYSVCELLQQGSTEGNDMTSKVIIRAQRRSGMQQVLDLSDPGLSTLGKVTTDGVYRLKDTGQWIVSQLHGYEIKDKLVE